MTPHQTIDDLISRVQRWLVDLDSLGQAFARSDATWKHLDELRKVVRAACDPGTGTVADREKAAYADPRYGEHLAALQDAHHVALSARAAYDTLRIKIDFARSVLATKRTELEKGL
jgi:hypothetical protein